MTTTITYSFELDTEAHSFTAEIEEGRDAMNQLADVRVYIRSALKHGKLTAAERKALEHVRELCALEF